MNNPTLELVEEIAASALPLERKIIQLVAIANLEPRESPVGGLACEKLLMLAGSRQTAALVFLLNAWNEGKKPPRETLCELVPALSAFQIVRDCADKADPCHQEKFQKG